MRKVLEIGILLDFPVILYFIQILLGATTKHSLFFTLFSFNLVDILVICLVLFVIFRLCDAFVQGYETWTTKQIVEEILYTFEKFVQIRLTPSQTTAITNETAEIRVLWHATRTAKQATEHVVEAFGHTYEQRFAYFHAFTLRARSFRIALVELF